MQLPGANVSANFGSLVVGSLVVARRARLMQRSSTMLAELSIIPLGKGTSLSDELAEILKLIDASGLAYQLTPSGTCIEGDWDAVIPVIRRAEERLRREHRRVFTSLSIDDHADARDRLDASVRDLERELGRAVRH